MEKSKNRSLVLMFVTRGILFLFFQGSNITTFTDNPKVVFLAVYSSIITVDVTGRNPYDVLYSNKNVAASIRPCKPHDQL